MVIEVTEEIREFARSRFNYSTREEIEQWKRDIRKKLDGDDLTPQEREGCIDVLAMREAQDLVNKLYKYGLIEDEKEPDERTEEEIKAHNRKLAENLINAVADLVHDPDFPEEEIVKAFKGDMEKVRRLKKQLDLP